MSGNKIPLDKDLSIKFTQLLSNVRSSVIETAELASKVRNQYLKEDGRRYDAEFNAFWKSHDMEAKFGSLSNFSKYASAGDVIGKVHAQFEEQSDRLPTTLNALYEFSQLTTDEMELCLTNTYSRTEVTPDKTKWKTPKKPKPLISPTIATSVIKTWRENWRNPKKYDIDERRLKVAEIQIHSSFFKFKSGVSHSQITPDQLSQLSNALKKVVTEFGSEVVKIDLFEQQLLQGYTKREAASIEKARTFVAQQKKKKLGKRKK